MTTKPDYSPSTAAWPTNAFEEIETIERKARSIQRLASAFDALHQTDLATELWEISSTLKLSADAIRAIVGEQCSRGYKDAQQATSNMLGAILAVSAVAEGKASP